MSMPLSRRGADRSSASRHRSAVRLVWAIFVIALLAAALLLAPRSAAAQDERLIGEWRGVEASVLGVMSTQVVFFPDGTYSRVHFLGTLMTRDTGTYQIVRNWIHFQLEDWGPTEFMGQPLAWPTSDTWVVTLFDGRVLQTENMRLERVQ